jgi:hypothetical protein
MIDRGARAVGAATARYNAGRVTAELAAPATITSPTQLRLAGTTMGRSWRGTE